MPFAVRSLLAAVLFHAAWSSSGSAAEPPHRGLIVDGQNNHGCWPTTTPMMRKYLEDTGLFRVDVVTHAPEGEDPAFQPAFADYDVVVSNFGHGAAEWPAATKAAFEAYVREGGGFVAVHAADNSFPKWPAYNEMIGLGGWGGRNESNGPYVYFDEAGKLVRDTTPGPGGSHGPQHEFPIVVRDGDHPVTRGMPASWMHAKDELYDSLRGPAENMAVLATAWSPTTKRHEPMIMTIDYGKGRVFHTPMGHETYSMECAGFITTFQRGCEWAATGKVTQELPKDFPGEAPASRPFAR
ncbi:MAG: ThuA domain-containing protein [Planctomycetota bacterium]